MKRKMPSEQGTYCIGAATKETTSIKKNISLTIKIKARNEVNIRLSAGETQGLRVWAAP